MTHRKDILLASSSPHRKAILLELGFEVFQICQDTEETVLDTAHATVVENAKRKLFSVVQDLKNPGIVLAADTVLFRGNDIFGKPASPESAKSVLRQFSGNTVSAITAVAVTNPAAGRKGIVVSEKADMTFRQLPEHMIEWYVSTGEPDTRAGALGISRLGELLVSRISGSYSCIAGLSKRAVLICCSDAILGDQAFKIPIGVRNWILTDSDIKIEYINQMEPPVWRIEA